MSRLRENLIDYLTLFSTSGTLICCALPAVLVSLGFGAVMAGFIGKFPGLIWISENKEAVFGFAASMLTVNGLLLWKNRNAPCPIEPNLREACLKGRRYSKIVYFVSLGSFSTGTFFAFIRPLI